MASYNLNEILKAKAGRTGNQVAARLDDVARVKVLSPGRQVFKRFIRNRLAVFGSVLLIIMFVFSFLGPLFYHCGQKEIFYKYDSQNINYGLATYRNPDSDETFDGYYQYRDKMYRYDPDTERYYEEGKEPKKPVERKTGDQQEPGLIHEQDTTQPAQASEPFDPNAIANSIALGEGNSYAWSRPETPAEEPVAEPGEEQTDSIGTIRERVKKRGENISNAEEEKEPTFFDRIKRSVNPDDQKTLSEIDNLEKQYKEFQDEYGQPAADEYMKYLRSQTDYDLPEGQRIGTQSGTNRRIWAKNAERKASEIKRQQAERDAVEAYDFNGTPYDTMNNAIDRDIEAARVRQGVAQQLGNNQGVEQEEAYIRQLEQQKAANKYYKELDNIERLEKNRNDDLEQYQKDQKEVDKQEKKINKMKKKNQDVTEEEAKLAEMERKRNASRDKYLASNEQFGNSANYIAAMNAYGNAQAQQQLWDINRSFSSKGTFDAYETGGQGVATWTAEFKEQTTILGNIEDYLATMASGEYL